MDSPKPLPSHSMSLKRYWVCIVPALAPEDQPRIVIVLEDSVTRIFPLHEENIKDLETEYGYKAKPTDRIIQTKGDAEGAGQLISHKYVILAENIQIP